MRRSRHGTTAISLVLLAGLALVSPNSDLYGSPSPSESGPTDLARIGSAGAMQTWLENLRAETSRAGREDRFTYDFQEQTLGKAGGAISRILELEKGARLSDPKVAETFRAAFEKVDELLRLIADSNEEVIDSLREERLDEVEDTQAFLDSPAWQTPQRLISLSRYWMSWNGYYRSLLYPTDSAERRKFLDESVAGFSLTLLDIAEQTIVAKSLFGRALCFKEMGKNEKAAKDLETITRHVTQNDPLYIWSLYEQARLRYDAGDCEGALGYLETMETEIEERTLSEVLGNEHKRLREKVTLEPRAKELLARIDREQDRTGEGAKRLCLEAHAVLRRLSRFDPTYATLLYRLVEENGKFFAELSYEDLGAVGYLALADDRFKKGEFAEAGKRYRRLWGSSDIYIRNRMDDIYFRSGYAYCQTGQWKEALASFDKLYAEFPKSGLIEKAVCLEYVAAAGNFKQSSSRSNYTRYLSSTKKYLKECPNPLDRNGAHFFVGEDYLEQKKTEKARKEFSAIEEGSPQYWPARYYMLESDVEALERRREEGKPWGKDERQRYAATASEFERFQRLPKALKRKPEIARIWPHMTILQARLLRCGGGKRCSEVLQALEGFEERFPANKPLWLTAMGLRLECFREMGLADTARTSVESLPQGYPVNRDLWDFLAEWGEAYDREAETRGRESNPEEVAAWREVALAAYTVMADIASKHSGYREYQDAVQFRIAEILMALGNKGRAAGIYREILARTPDAAEALSQLGRIYEDQGQWDRAIEMWRTYSKGTAEGSAAWLDARYRIALAHSEMGRKQAACDVITMIRVLHPDTGDEATRAKVRALEKAVCGEGDRATGR